jgi:hypothetical protein
VITRVLLDLDAFFLEHRLCGDLDGGASSERGGWRASHVARGSGGRWRRRRAIVGPRDLHSRSAWWSTCWDGTSRHHDVWP